MKMSIVILWLLCVHDDASGIAKISSSTCVHTFAPRTLHASVLEVVLRNF